MPHKKHAPETLTCLNCGAENDSSAYCCITCFKVMRPKTPIPFWKIYIRPSAPMLLAVFVVAGLGIAVFKRWIENVEAQITMNFKSTEYNVSVVADKRKRGSVFNLKRESAENEKDGGEDTPRDSEADQQ